MNVITGTAVTAAATSSAFTQSGEGKLIATLGPGEWVKLQEEHVDGVYRDVINSKGQGVVLSASQQSVIFTGYGNYKVVKSVTVANTGTCVEG